ncbi:MAG: class I SAM-dependent methyltransferase, partial [Thermodesulfobacteriota bacterium]
MASAVYDRIGVGYERHRRPDPRVAARIARALGPSRSVLDVGAGAGSYEPAHLDVIAVEPSRVMAAQRAPGAAPVVRAVAEALPFKDASFDAALAVLTVHHWSDFARGMAEMRRVARARVVVLTWSPELFRGTFWFARDYLPEALDAERGVAALDAVAAALPGCRVETVPVPHDCRDGFFGAYWRRPEAYLRADVRGAISGLARLDQRVVLRA